MITRIDHLVIGVHDLGQAMSDYETLGFTVQPGGIHAGGLTHNALMGFADGTYIELIAFTDPSQPSDHRWWEAIAAGEGLIDFAVGTDNVAEDVQRLTDAGVTTSPPVDGGRTRPDGQQVGWRNLVLPDATATALPFVIEDRTPRHLRVPGGADAMHGGGFQAVDGITLAVPDLPAAVHAYTALLGDRGTGITPSVEGGKRAHRFTVGDQWVELNEPDDNDSPLRQAVSRRGATPYSVILRTADRSYAAPDARLTHGARIELKQ